MKKLSQLLSTTLVLVLCASSISFAVNDQTSTSPPKEKILFEQEEITDKNILLERAKQDITDDKNSKFQFKIDGDVDVVNQYQTTQLLERKNVGDEILSDYVATGIVELNVDSEDTTAARICAGNDPSVIYLTKSGEVKQVVASDHYIGDDRMTTHVLVYNTMYYTTAIKTDWQGNPVNSVTFTKASGKLTTYDGASFSNAKVKLFASGIEVVTGDEIAPSKSISLGTASTYSTATGFTSMYNNFGGFDAPVFSIRTTIPWKRGTETGTSIVTYVYVVGDDDGQWFDD